MDSIPGTGSLHHLFEELIDRHFDREIALRDAAIKQYVADLLTTFADADQLRQIRNAAGKPLEDVGEMLLESDPIFGPAPSFDRERQVRKHIGDYTLFFTGMFPESINRFRLRKNRLESFLDFMKAGKESYHIVSEFDRFEYQKVAPMFAKLAHEFEACVFGLNCVKGELEEMQHSIVRQQKEIVM